MPLGNPTRLIVEAKCLTRNVGLNPLRNAVGVLIDVNEYFTGGGTAPAKHRYTYRYAVASATPFTRPAKEYAFAHDIVLFPMSRNAFMQPVLNAIRSFGARDLTRPNGSTTAATELRQSARDELNGEARRTGTMSGSADEKLRAIRNSLRLTGGALLAFTEGGLPLLLIPERESTISQLAERGETSVRFYFDRESWYIRDAEDRTLFNFDLPVDILNMYASGKYIEPAGALDLKQREFSHLQAFANIDGRLRLVMMRLDANWVDAMRAALPAPRRSRRRRDT